MVPCMFSRYFAFLFSQDVDSPLLKVRAQGLNNAMEDAGPYVKAIQDIAHYSHKLGDRIHAYDASSYRRGKTDIMLSNEQMYADHHWETIMDSPLVKGGYNQKT